MWAHLQKVLQVRRDLASLRRGTLRHLVVAEQQYAYARSLDGEHVIVVINNATTPAAVSVPIGALEVANGTHLVDRLEVVTGTLTVADGAVNVSLPARSAAILSKAP